MTVDALLSELRMKRLRVTNLYEGTDDVWRCCLRTKNTEIVHALGVGETPAAAIRCALDGKAPSPAPVDQFEDLLG